MAFNDVIVCMYSVPKTIKGWGKGRVYNVLLNVIPCLTICTIMIPYHYIVIIVVVSKASVPDNI